MIGEVLGPGSNRSRLCHKSMRHDVVIMLVPSPSLLVSPTARNRRSARSRRGQMREVEDDKWGRGVSDREFKMDFSIFKNG